jgi:ABC-type glycerol-3-phosphate transport system permease component
MSKKGSIKNEIWKHIFIVAIIFFALFPLYLMLNISLKDNQQFVLNPWLPASPYHWENWTKAWEIVSPSIANTIVIATGHILIALLAGIFGAYFFARYKMPGSKILFGMFLLLMMYPGVSNMVPLFNLLSYLKMLNSLWTLVLVGSAGAQVLLVYVLRNFIEDIPDDFFDAAEIDGAGPIQQIKNIVLPMSGSIISVLTIMNIIGVWNNFVLPLIVIRDNAKQPLAVMLLRLEGEYTRNWGVMMAGYSIASIPLIILFIFTMRLFIKGLSSSAIKG